MNKWLKRAGMGTLTLGATAALAFVGAVQLGERKAERRIAVDVAPVALHDDAASIARGRYLFMSRGCTECHGANGAGGVVFANGAGTLVRAPNITPGLGGVVGGYAATDWVRTIRHGVKPDGRPLQVMPSEDYNRFTDADLAALIAFVRHLPPVAGEPAVVRLPAPLKALYGIGVVPDAAERIDHRLPPAQPVAEGINPAHGAYVANTCIGCHGANLSGGKIASGPPDWPAAANLTPGDGSALARYPNADSFVAMLRSGNRPDGSAVSKVMPFGALKEISDTDARALYVYLQSLPPRAAGNR